jgi:hypothetical protein
MSVRGFFVSGLAVTCLVVPAGIASAAPVQIDMTGSFNADVIVNGNTSGLDPTQDPVDNVSYSLATQKAMESTCSFVPKGLPNDGLFPANSKHPLVQLAYRNNRNGMNARRSEAGDAFTVLVPQAKYQKVHLFMTSGDDPSDVKAILKYKGGSTTVKTFTVPDWFSSTTGPGGYSLIGGLDRMTPTGGTCDESAAGVFAHVFGQKISANANKTLKSITVEKADVTSSVLNTFGAIAIKA